MQTEAFIISFFYELEDCNRSVALQAIAERVLKHAGFKVHSFRMQSNMVLTDDRPVLPPVEITTIQKNGETFWIHYDSEKESGLSRAIGMAIDALDHT